jgi:hypothetical protein
MKILRSIIVRIIVKTNILYLYSKLETLKDKVIYYLHRPKKGSIEYQVKQYQEAEREYLISLLEINKG